MFQTDSIAVMHTDSVADTVAHRHALTPAEIISWLPRDATPYQQDSAVQSRIKPKEIHWSQRPDTLHLPSHDVGKSIFDVSLPQYYKENFFATKEYYHPEITGGRQGAAGDPPPDTIAHDNYMTSLLLVCFLGIMVSVSLFRSFIGRQWKLFVYGFKGNRKGLTETEGEVIFQLFLAIVGCLTLAIAYLFYLRTYVADTFTVGQNQVILMLTGVFVAYFVVKAGLYTMVNRIFFNTEKSRQWTQSEVFLTAMQSLVLFPIVLVQTYFGLDFKTAATCIVFVVVLFKLMAIYKQKQIFFAQKGQLLQFFLYFCALELTPLLMLWSVLEIMSGFLKINF